MFTWVFYHTYMRKGLSKRDSQYYEKITPEGDAENRITLAEEQYRFSYKRLSAPLGRMFLTLMIHVTHISAFLFAFNANVNGGIISTIFSTSCVFTFIIFYFKYGQKITMSDVIGTIFVLVCVTLISLPTPGTESDSEEELDNMFLILALCMALAAGLTLTFNTININYVIGTGFDLD